MSIASEKSQTKGCLPADCIAVGAECLFAVCSGSQLRSASEFDEF